MTVEVHDTLREVTTITIRENEKGDTLKVVQVTERDRVRDRSRADRATNRTVVRTDSVDVKRDSVDVEVKRTGLSASADEKESRSAAVVKVLKWIFFIILGLIAYRLTAYWVRRAS